MSGKLLSWLPVLIFGTLAGFHFVPIFLRDGARTSTMGCFANLKNIGTALDMYAQDHRGRYPKNLKLLVPEYLRRLPQCESAKRDTYSESYQTDPKFKAFTVFCAGRNHARLEIPANYPRYNSNRGLVEGL